MTKQLFIAICFAFVGLQPALADTSAEYKKSIKKIGREINAISRNLNANKAILKTERDKLFEIEQSLQKLRKDIDNTNTEIASLDKTLKRLDKQLDKARAEQKISRQALAALIESRYKNGSDNYLKRVLNQENPYAVGRLNNYHGYFSKALQLKLQQIQKMLITTQALKSEHQIAVKELEARRLQQEKQQQDWSKVKKRRTQSIARLDKKVATSSEKLEQLRQNRNRLNSLLKKIAKQKAQLERLDEQRRKEQQKRSEQNKKPSSEPQQAIVRAPVKGGFLKQRGRLAYPAIGVRKRKFGSRLVESGMTSEGIFIDTKRSVPVKSIFRGRVLFAEFLKGYGLLLIIDHGDDHISLYGHNQLLYKNVGDYVETNELVAKTGVTGGLKSPGLYFEIRRNATPVNPDKWCQ